MEYFDLYHQLKESFSLDKDEIFIKNVRLRIFLPSFNSSIDDSSYEAKMLSKLQCSYGTDNEDSKISENNCFKYPVFIPEKRQPGSNVIILLHGLNERSWHKYLPWACYLAMHTNKAVIGFPISFHMNRGCSTWTERQEMAPLVTKRKKAFHDNLIASTFVNYAISNRLTNSPQRFLLSGLQTYNDLISLMVDINQGKNRLFEYGTGFDFFSYSIGGFISQILMLSHPLDILTPSRHFLFCSGCLFEDMNGISKSILDNQAIKQMQHFYLKELPEKVKNPGPIRDFFQNSKVARAFRAMLTFDILRDFKKDIFQSAQQNTLIYSLQNDTVMPPDKVQRSFGDPVVKLPNHVILDFPYPHSHESPFPVSNKNYRDAVNTAFNQVFNRAAHFLM